VEKKHIHLIGLDTSGLTPEKAQIVSSCSDIFCSDRFLNLLHPLTGSHDMRIFPISPISETLDHIKEIGCQTDIAVLAGGDPLFFGIGKILCRTFGSESVDIHPAVSSMQEAFARFCLPWDDAEFLSVHGRKLEDVIQHLHNRNKFFFLTDGQNTPASLASFFMKIMGEKNAAGYEVYVAENLGTENERLFTGKLKDISEKEFSELSVMILIGKEGRRSLQFGLLEDEIVHSRGLITKNEIRATTLHALRLPNKGVFWDIGAGSGSLSIEASGIVPELFIYAVESKPEELKNICSNRERYCAYTVQPTLGSAPEILFHLPDPHRVFVGGSGGKLKEILEYSTERLQPEGIIVVNGVLEKTCLQAPAILHELGFEVFISTVQVRRVRYPEAHPVDLNPISIITGRKK